MLFENYVDDSVLMAIKYRLVLRTDPLLSLIKIRAQIPCVFDVTCSFAYCKYNCYVYRI